MTMPFLDRHEELQRIRRALAAPATTFICLYGRRRCGKSRLVLEALRGRPAVYYVGDEREAALQRQALAQAMARLVPGFDQVLYPDWTALLTRWWREAPPQAVLALDEFPAVVSTSASLPSVLQKLLDTPDAAPRHVIVCGSSQRMMHGLVLDGNAPLYGRAREIIRLQPLGPHWISRALRCPHARAALDAYAVWGGMPRYWELAAAYRRTDAALRALVLDPQGVLHDEPYRLLLDDVREVAQASSILSLIGQGCHRLSEIAGRLGKPATSLTRPLTRLVDLGLVVRDVCFGEEPRSSKRSLYHIADPFLRFWFRFVAPYRSQLAARQIADVARAVAPQRALHTGQVWEDVARASVARMRIGGVRWQPAARWWGRDARGAITEIDVVAESFDHTHILLGEAKLTLRPEDALRIQHALEALAQRLPVAQGKKIVYCIWNAGGTGMARATPVQQLTVDEVFTALT